MTLVSPPTTHWPPTTKKKSVPSPTVPWQVFLQQWQSPMLPVEFDATNFLWMVSWTYTRIGAGTCFFISIVPTSSNFSNGGKISSMICGKLPFSILILFDLSWNTAFQAFGKSRPFQMQSVGLDALPTSPGADSLITPDHNEGSTGA